MRNFMMGLTLLSAVALTVPPAWAQQADQAGKNANNPTADSGNGAAAESSKSGPGKAELHLTEAQRQKIRAVVADDKTDVTFKDDAPKGDKDFTPSLGAAIPAKLPMQAMPPALAAELPMLANFSYVKMKGKIRDRQPDVEEDRRHLRRDTRLASKP